MRASYKIGIALATLGSLAVLQAALRSARGRRQIAGNGVLITGGSRGLGFAVATEFVRNGASVAICGRDPETLETAAERLRGMGGDVLTIPCDVRRQREIEAAVQRAFTHFGRLDVLVNNAGTIAVGPMAAMTRADYQDALDTHFWAMYYAVEAALPVFRAQGCGAIVNVTSIGGRVSVPHLLPYCVSKFAAVAYSEGLHAELARENVTVTTVVPGLMRTGSPRNAWFKAQHEKEYTWFALSDTLPGISIAARAAARSIVAAYARRKPDVVLSLPAKAIALVHGVAPGFTEQIMSLIAALLPGPGGIETRRERGERSQTRLTESPLTILGRIAERDYNQLRRS